MSDHKLTMTSPTKPSTASWVDPMVEGLPERPTVIQNESLVQFIARMIPDPEIRAEKLAEWAAEDQDRGEGN